MSLNQVFLYVFVLIFPIFIFLIDAIIDIHIMPAHRSHVTISGTSWIVFINIITARVKIAQKAPLSKYTYLFKVHLLTSIMVKLLTNIAHIHSHNAIMKIFLLNAKAHITPSREKLASNISR